MWSIGEDIATACCSYALFPIVQIGVALAFVSALMSKEVFPDAICSVLKATGIIYGTVHFILVSTLYFVSFAIVVAVMVVSRQEQVSIA